MNFVNITVGGHLGKDAELVTTQSGKQMLRFSIACNVGYGDKKVLNWYECVMFGERGQSLQQYLLKGTAVIVNGELKAVKSEKDGRQYFNLSVNVQNLSFAGNKDGKNADGTVDDDVVPF